MLLVNTTFVPIVVKGLVTVTQFPDDRLVVVCNEKLGLHAGQERTTASPDKATPNDGAKFNANNVPLPLLPPPNVVPYKIVFNKTNPDCGPAPSLLVELEPEVAVNACRIEKFKPFVLRANNVPLPLKPPPCAVP